MSEGSKISKAQQKAVNKYVKNNYDRIELTIKPKGKKETLKNHAEKNGETLNAFINRAINETMERDNANQSQPAATGSKEPVRETVPVQTADPNQGRGVRKYRKLTETAIRGIDLAKLASSIPYQLDIVDAYGQEALAMLMEKARQQDVSASSEGT